MGIKTEIKVYRVEKRCEDVECNGKMEVGSTAFMTSPPRFPHYCTVCCRTSTYLQSYPYIAYEDIEPYTQGMGVK